MFEIFGPVILNLFQDLTKKEKNEMLNQVQHDTFFLGC